MRLPQRIPRLEWNTPSTLARFPLLAVRPLREVSFESLLRIIPPLCYPYNGYPRKAAIFNELQVLFGSHPATYSPPHPFAVAL
jgi:hypothetical protein